MSVLHVYRNNVLSLNGNQYRCALGKSGIATKLGEGDKITPVGTYPLLEVFYRPDRVRRPATDLPMQTTSPIDAWCDDPTDTQNYNKFVHLPHPGSFENLWRDDEVYDVVVVIGYNVNPVIAGKGSCIFMHIARPGYTPTYGCIALNRPDMLRVLKALDKNSKVAIHASDFKSKNRLLGGS